MFNTKRRSDVSKLLIDIELLKTQALQNPGAHLPLSVSLQDNEMQQVLQATNELLAIQQQQYKALATKHEIVTELNGIGTWDGEIHNGRLTEDSKNTYNTIFRSALGYEDEQDFPNVLSSWYNTVSKQDLERVSTAYDDLLDNDIPYDIEYRSVNKDDSVEWVAVRAKTLRDQNGHPYRHIGTLMNIHENKENSLKVQQLLSKLELIEQSLNFSWNSETVEGVWGAQLKNSGTNEENYWFSPQFKQLLGFKQFDYFEPSIETWMNMIVSEEREIISNQLQNYLADSERTTVILDFRLETADGASKWFSMTVKTLRDSVGQPTLLSGVLRDIHHDIKRLEDNEHINQNMKSFNVVLSELADNIKDISKEAADLAHENELTLTSSQKARKSIEATKAVTQLIKNISDQTNLLGINASIEASLAGEHGKGFKVVAGEIQKLSTNTAQAVENIEQILEDTKKAVLQIVDSIDTMTGKIQHQANVTQDIEQATATIKNNSKELLTLIQQLD